MNHSQFIAQEVRKIDASPNEPHAHRNGSQTVSSIMCDGSALFSYGSHYPLLFPVIARDGSRLWVCNNAGYSSSTGKHISRAGQFADIFAKLPRYQGFTHTADRMNREAVTQALRDELVRLKKEMDATKRKDTQKFSSMTREYERVQGYLTRIDQKS